MTAFVHVDQSLEHAGVRRAGDAIDFVRAEAQGSRGPTALVLAAIVAALIAVADKFISDWTDGSLLAAWLALWAVAFVALALFASTARRLALRATVAWAGFARRAAAARADARFLETAKNDPRIMRDLQAAMTRDEGYGDAVAPEAAPKGQALMAARSEAVRVPTLYEAMRRMNSGRYY